MIETVNHTDIRPLSGKEIIVILFAMVLFSVLEYGYIQHTKNIDLIFIVSAFVYFLKLYLYYGIATLAFHRKTWQLWISAVAVYIIAYLFAGIVTVWTLLADWSMILFGSVIMGRYLIKEANYQRVYTVGLLAVLGCAFAMYAPNWSLYISAFDQFSVELLESMKETLPLLQYSAEESASFMDMSTKSMALLKYLIPAMTLLSSLMQFSIGFLIFLYVLIRKKKLVKPMAPFTMWKMPYYLTGLILAGAVFHFFGNELIIQIGDNLLFILSVFYAVTGLSLFEYFLTKIKLHWSMKLGMYLLLLLTAHLGYIAFVLLGFIDSFKDFRKIELLSLQSK